MKEKIVLVGGGGHCKSCIDVIETQGKYEIVGIVDVKEKLHAKIFKYDVIATDDDLPNLIKDYNNFLVTLGQLTDFSKRIKIYDLLINNNALMPTIISPYAYVSKYSTIGHGTIIMHKSVVNGNTEIGNNSIINTGAIIEHDCSIGSHCHISTGSVINGGCIIKDKTLIGSNITVIEGISIEKDIVVGAGSTVIKSIIDKGIYAGNPTKKINEK